MPDPGDTGYGDRGQGTSSSTGTTSKSGNTSGVGGGGGGGGGSTGSRGSSTGSVGAGNGTSAGGGQDRSGGAGGQRGAGSNYGAGSGRPGTGAGGQGGYNSGTSGSRYGGASTQAPGSGSSQGKGAGQVSNGGIAGISGGNFRGPGVNDLNAPATSGRASGNITSGTSTGSQPNGAFGGFGKFQDRVPEMPTVPTTTPSYGEQYYQNYYGDVVPRGANMPTQQDVLTDLARRGANMDALAKMPDEAFSQPSNFDPNFNAVNLPSTSQFPNTYAPGESTYAAYNNAISGMTYNPSVAPDITAQNTGFSWGQNPTALNFSSPLGPSAQLPGNVVSLTDYAVPGGVTPMTNAEAFKTWSSFGPNPTDFPSAYSPPTPAGMKQFYDQVPQEPTVVAQNYGFVNPSLAPQNYGFAAPSGGLAGIATIAPQNYGFTNPATTAFANNPNTVAPGHWKREEDNYLTQLGVMDRIQKDPRAALGYDVMQNPDGSGLMLSGETPAGIYGQYNTGTNAMAVDVGYSPVDYAQTIGHELGHAAMDAQFESAFGKDAEQAVAGYGPEQEETIQRLADYEYTPPTSKIHQDAEKYLISKGIIDPITPQNYGFVNPTSSVGSYTVSAFPNNQQITAQNYGFQEPVSLVGANSGEWADVGPLTDDDIYAQNTGFVSPSVIVGKTPYIGSAATFDYWSKNLNPLSGTATAGVLAAPSSPVVANVQPQNFGFTNPYSSPAQAVVSYDPTISPTAPTGKPFTDRLFANEAIGTAYNVNNDIWNSLTPEQQLQMNTYIGSIPTTNPTYTPAVQSMVAGDPRVNMAPGSYPAASTSLAQYTTEAYGPPSIVEQEYAFSNPYMAANKEINERIGPANYVTSEKDVYVGPTEMAVNIAPQYLDEVRRMMGEQMYTPPTGQPTTQPTVVAGDPRVDRPPGSYMPETVPEYTPPADSSPWQEGAPEPDPFAPPTNQYIGPYTPDMDSNNDYPIGVAQDRSGYGGVNVQPTSGPPPSGGGGAGTGTGGSDTGGSGGSGGGDSGNPGTDWFNSYYNNPPYQTTVPLQNPVSSPIYRWDTTLGGYVLVDQAPATT